MMPVETSIDVRPIDILIELDDWVASEFAAIMAASGILASTAVAFAPRTRLPRPRRTALRILAAPCAELIGHSRGRARVRSPPREI